MDAAEIFEHFVMVGLLAVVAVGAAMQFGWLAF